jgi:Mg2+ and Co2+ transporter CorA
MENTTQPQTQPQTDVTITDLFLIRGILDVAIQRGTFRGEELVQIGEIYNKLMNFLNMISEQAQQAQQAQQEANQTESDQPPPNNDSLQGE